VNKIAWRLSNGRIAFNSDPGAAMKPVNIREKNDILVAQLAALAARCPTPLNGSSESALRS